ncbi:MAG: hypothetical protein ACKONH_00985 [Planctomycetia bacterium]
MVGVVTCLSAVGADPRDEAPHDTASAAAPAAVVVPDPLAGTPRIDPATTGIDAERNLATMLPPRNDSPRDWQAPLEPLHDCGEPRALPPCLPPPVPYDLVGVSGVPSCGPIYRGPCAPRSAATHDGPFRWLHALHDRLFDLFYRSR